MFSIRRYWIIQSIYTLTSTCLLHLWSTVAWEYIQKSSAHWKSAEDLISLDVSELNVKWMHNIFDLNKSINWICQMDIRWSSPSLYKGSCRSFWLLSVGRLMARTDGGLLLWALHLSYLHLRVTLHIYAPYPWKRPQTHTHTRSLPKPQTIIPPSLLWRWALNPNSASLCSVESKATMKNKENY